MGRKAKKRQGATVFNGLRLGGFAFLLGCFFLFSFVFSSCVAAFLLLRFLSFLLAEDCVCDG
jgi:hypothetical protein